MCIHLKPYQIRIYTHVFFASSPHTHTHVYVYIYIYIHIYVYILKIFPHTHLYRATQSIMYIPFQVNRFKKVFYLSFNTNIQIPVLRILFSKIQRKSDPPHKIMRDCTYYSTQLASSFPPGRNLPGGNDLYRSCTSFEGASWRGQPLNIFTWFIGAGGYTPIHMYPSLRLHTLAHMFISIYTYVHIYVYTLRTFPHTYLYIYISRFVSTH